MPETRDVTHQAADSLCRGLTHNNSSQVCCRRFYICFQLRGRRSRRRKVDELTSRFPFLEGTALSSRLHGLLLTAFGFVVSISVSVAHADILSQFEGGNLYSVAALNGTGFIPPDMGGSVGGGYVMQMINGQVSAYTTAGNAVGSPQSLNSFWSGTNALGGTYVSDPRLIYNPSVGRWFASAISTQSTNNSILLAVSNNSNPTSGFNEFSISSATNAFADFPTLGVNGAALTIGTNNFSGSTGSYIGSSLYSIPLSSLIAPTPSLAGLTQFNQTNQVGITPQAVTNPSGAGTSTTVLSTNYNSDGLYISTVSGANVASASLALTSTVSGWLGALPHDPTQPGGTSYDGGDNRLSSGAYQVGSLIYFTNSVWNGTSDAIQWGILNTTDQTVMQGTLSIPGLDLSYPSISANANGTFVIGFNGSGGGTNIGGYSVVCSQSQGTCGNPSLLFTSPANNYDITGSGRNRWGDYSSAIVDPSNPNNFWLFQEYASSNSSWGTVITEISTVPEPPTLAFFAFGLSALGLFGWRRRQKVAAA